MTREGRLLIGALRRAVAGKTETLSLDVDWQATLKLAGAHMLLPLLYNGLHSSKEDWNQVPDDIKIVLYSAFLQAIYRDSQLEYIHEQLSQKLSAKHVPHVFLKGAVLKYDYPVPALRTMCDLDVLVHIEDYPKLASIAKSMKGTPAHNDGNHRNYSFPGGIVVEFHPNLLHQDAPIGTEINPGWQYVDVNDPYKLTEEGFYLHTICHLAHHFATGGVGVRFVLDVWVACHLRKSQPNREKLEAELENIGLLEFAKMIESLAEYWFGEGECTQLLGELEEYIMTSGSHGLSSRSMLNAVSLSSGESWISALLDKMFYSQAEMEGRFPWCKARPWLLPIAWCMRAFKAVTKHGQLILQWGKGTRSVSRAKATMQKEKLERFGIKRNRKRRRMDRKF